MYKKSVVYFVLVTILFVLSACESKKRAEVLDTSKQSLDQMIKKQPNMDEYIVSCTKPDHSNVNLILQKLEASNAEGVVLYFHGGLSTENYMRSNLGPKLISSKFLDIKTTKLYPIFITYDAGILENLPLKKQFTLNALKKELNKSKYGRAIVIISRVLGKRGKNKDHGLGQADYEFNYEFADKLNELAAGDFSQEDKLAAHLINTDEDLKGLAIQLDAHIGDSVGGAEEKVFGLSPYKSAKLIYRIIHRHLSKTAHQFVPTIIEELMRSYHVDEIAQNHWNNIYKKSEGCWSKGQESLTLIKRLIEIKEEKAGLGESFTINVLSHSAGSIPIAYLVKHLSGGAYPERVLDNVIMVAPAINQTLFEESIVTCPNVYLKYRAFILSRNDEKSDNVALFYPASLLYFVSGVAEKVRIGDRMLLISEHLDRNENPYKSKKYQLKLKKNKLGSPANVWDYFDANQEVRPDIPRADTDARLGHTSTKQPWKTQGLGRLVLKEMGVKETESIIFIKPK